MLDRASGASDCALKHIRHSTAAVSARHVTCQALKPNAMLCPALRDTVLGGVGITGLANCLALIWPPAHCSNVGDVVHDAVGKAGRRGHHQHCVVRDRPCHSLAGEPVVAPHPQLCTTFASINQLKFRGIHGPVSEVRAAADIKSRDGF